VFGAFRPAPGEALTETYASRSAANFADFLDKTDAWLPTEIERVYAILDNLSAHRATDVLVFAVTASALGIRLPAQVCRLPEVDPFVKTREGRSLSNCTSF
jgi:hypothetical protein